MFDISCGPHYRNKHTSLLNVQHTLLQNTCYALLTNLELFSFIKTLGLIQFSFYFIVPTISLPHIFYMLEEREKENGKSEWVVGVSYLKVKEAVAGEKIRAK